MGLNKGKSLLTATQAAKKVPPPPQPQLQEQKPRGTTFKRISARPGWIGVKTPFQQKDFVKTLTGREWSKTRKQWEIPFASLEEALTLFPGAYVDPELLHEFKDLQARNERKVAAKTADVQIEVPGLKANLYAYQQQGLAFLDELRKGEGSVLAFDMGLGKSILSIAFALRKIQQGEAKYCMIVCPAPLKFATWAKEFEKFTDEEVVVIDGDTPEEVELEDGKLVKLKDRELREVQYLQYLCGVKFFVMNYELFLHDVPDEAQRGEHWVREKNLAKTATADYERLIETCKNELGLCEADAIKRAGECLLQEFYGFEDWVDYRIQVTTSKKTPYAIYRRTEIKDVVPELNGDWIVVLDEAHRIKNPRASTTRNLLDKTKNAGFKILGTGTPLENSIEELWQLVDLCKPGLLGSWWNFQQRFIEHDWLGQSTGHPIRERLPELKSKIEPIMIRKTKAEALPDLPPLTVIDRWVDMTPEQADIYEEVKSGVLEDVDGNDNYLEALAQLTRFQQICDSPALLNEYLGKELPPESGKLLELPVILSEIRPEENKVIVFTQYETMARRLVKVLQEWYPQYRTVTVTGRITDNRERQKMVDAFQEDEKTRFIVMTTAGNYGLNLQAASYVIAYDETFNPQKMEQVYSRAHRNGQKNAVIAINLKTRDTYEERKAKILEGKRTVFAAMIDDDEAAFARILGSAKELRSLI